MTLKELYDKDPSLIKKGLGLKHKDDLIIYRTLIDFSFPTYTIVYVDGGQNKFDIRNTLASDFEVVLEIEGLEI